MQNNNARPSGGRHADQADQETIDEPIMDGATDTFEGNEDPRKSMSDPALIRHPEEGDKTLKPYN